LKPYLLCGLFLITDLVFANDLSKKNLIINGLTKTKMDVIETELSLYPELAAEDSRQLLLQTGLFSNVEVKKEESKTEVTVNEKWTTIPILKFNSGGGAKQTVFGVYDPNILGRRLEMGFQLETLEGAPSQVFWLKDPRFFSSRFFIDLQYWNTQRIRLKYDPEINSPTLTKALLLKTQKSHISLGYEFSTNLKLRSTFENYTDKFSTERIPQNLLDQVLGQTLPINVDSLQIGIAADFGRLKLDKNVTVGTLISLQYKIGLVKKPDNVPNFNWVRADLLHYTKLTDTLIYSQRAQIGLTDTNVLQYWNYLGGLESIRGFADNRFATRGYWLSNSELRHITLENSNYILQTVGFLDFLGIDEASRELQNITAASAGAGVRIEFPKVYRLVLRADYSRPFVNSDNQSINLGLQQFF
jgi:outer membrane protein assembly factor BamA